MPLTVTELRITKLRRESNFESLFWNEESSHPLRPLFQKASDRKLIERHIEMLGATQETESELFWQDSAASNLLAFLYLFIKDYQQAAKQLTLTLERAPNNLNAIVGMVRIMEKQKRSSEVKKRVEKYERLRENGEETEKQMLVCRGEIAYACSFIGPDFYIQAVERYEDLLRLDSKDELNGYVIRWQYYLAYTYNRMLNKGHRETLLNKLRTKNIVKVFDKIHQLYDAVIKSDDKVYKGKAMIDLVDTYKKCETFGNCQNMKFPYGCSSDEYVKRAMDTAPSDPHVLERCGRHYRQRASSKKDFEEAVEIFDEVLESHPSRHVAWHHKGLACRALWHIVGKYDAARLYNNNARKGEKRGVRRHMHMHGQPAHVDGASASTTKCHQTDHCASGQGACGSTSLHNAANDEQITVAEDSLSNSRKPPQTAPRQLPTLRARNRRDIDHVPRQPTKSDFFDRLRTSNPAAKDDNSRRFLEQAKVCFEQAKKITKETCSPYIVDLARSFISLGSYDDAEREFQTADKLDLRNDNDATYLYEQWALLRHDLAKREVTLTPDEARHQLKDVANLYRQAIRHAVRAREKSRIAFYSLRDLLHEELQQDSTNAAVRMEYEVLYSSVQKYSECRDNMMLVKALENEEETRDMAWQLIALLRDRRQPHDASAAFMYLTALHAAGQLDFDEGSPASASDTQLSNRELIDMVYQLVRDRRRDDGHQSAVSDSGKVVDRHDNGQTFGEIFRWIVGTRYISESIKVEPNSPRPFADSGEICILAPSYETQGVSKVVEILREVCSIAVVKAFCEGECDIRWENQTSEGLRSVVAISQSVVVVVDSTDTANWLQLIPMLEELLIKAEMIKTCLVADERTDCSKIESRYVERWPLVTIPADKCDHVQLAYTLLKTLLCRHK